VSNYAFKLDRAQACRRLTQHYQNYRYLSCRKIWGFKNYGYADHPLKKWRRFGKLPKRQTFGTFKLAILNYEVLTPRFYYGMIFENERSRKFVNPQQKKGELNADREQGSSLFP
jgi:hypothetical protein